MMWHMLLIMVSMWLTGFLFVQNLGIFFASIAVYFSLTYNAATWKQRNSPDEVTATPRHNLSLSLSLTRTHTRILTPSPILGHPFRPACR